MSPREALPNLLGHEQQEYTLVVLGQKMAEHPPRFSPGGRAAVIGCR